MKTLTKTLTTSLAIVLTKLSAFAYQIPSEYRPENQPFGFTDTYIQPGEKAVNGIILILQVIEGGLLYFAAPLGVIVIAYAGLQMIIDGTGEGFATGKKTIIWGLGGLLAIILSYSIVRIAITLLLEFGD